MARRTTDEFEPTRQGGTTYVEITREEFEAFLDTLKYRWKQKAGTKGVYALALSERVAIEVSSSLTGADQSMGYAQAAMQTRLVSTITGHTLNKVAQGQTHYKRTKGWRESLKAGIERIEDAYRKSESFYEAIAGIEDRTVYKKETTVKIESIPGWERDQFLSDLHARVEKDGVLTLKQMDALDRSAAQAAREPAAPEGLSLAQLRALWVVAKEDRDDEAMALAEALGKQMKAGITPRSGDVRRAVLLARPYMERMERVIRERKLGALKANTKDKERFNDRLNEVPDLKSTISKLINTLAPLRDVDYTPMSHAKALAYVISTAATVENEAALNANMEHAFREADDLRQALQAVKKHLEDTDDGGEDGRARWEDAISDGTSQLRALVSALKNI